MKQLRITKYIALTITALAVAVHVNDSSAQSYPNGAVYDMFTKEQAEAKRAEEMEQKAIEEKARLDEQKRNAESEIAAHRYRIEGLKMRQDKAAEDLNVVNVDLQAVKEQIASVQAEHKETEDNAKATLDYLAAVSSDLQQKQTQLNEETVALNNMKKRAQESIFAKNVEMERMKGEVARIQTKVEDLRAQAASLSAEEMQVRSDWMQNKMAVAENNRVKAEALANMQNTQKALAKAQGELNASRTELAKAERQRKNMEITARQQIAEFERQIASANRSKVNAEAEKIRVESETQKIREYASRIKDNRDQAIAEKEASQGLVMQSTLALESARSELTQVAEEASKDAYRQMRREAQSRGLAAASKAYQMVDGARPFVINNKCSGYRKPASEGNAASSFEAGSKIFARPAGSSWVEVVNGSGGKPTYVESKCGSFEN